MGGGEIADVRGDDAQVADDVGFGLAVADAPGNRQRLLLMADGRRKIAAGPGVVAQVVQRRAFAAGVAQLAIDRQRAARVRLAAGKVGKLDVGVAQVGERVGFRHAVADLAAERQRALDIADRLVILVAVHGHPGEPVEQRALQPAVAHGHGFGQRRLKRSLCGVQLTQEDLRHRLPVQAVGL